MTKSSPRLSISSADEALFEILGVDKLILVDADEDDDDANTDSKDHASHPHHHQHHHHDDTEHDSASPSTSASASTHHDNADGTTTISTTTTRTTTTASQHHTPPRHCHRPLTPHTPLLLETRPLLLSPAQCSYIIHNLGYRTTNNGGKTFGPTYITAAALSPQQQQLSGAGDDHGSNGGGGSGGGGGVTVQLLNPNHHKVCVFYSELVLTWLQQAFEKAGIDDAIQTWCRMNGIHHNKDDSSSSSSQDYRINPRLRLLRYDAADHDIFLPHYDATTTTSTTTKYESKLTILLYLNTGGGVHFHGGNTIFLNSLQPSENMLEIVPKLGKFLIFNHELYHASQELMLSNVNDQQAAGGNGADCGGTKFVLRSDQQAAGGNGADCGGTKFVLRSDVMFPIQHVTTETNQTPSNNNMVSSSSFSPPPLLQQPTDGDENDNVATAPALLLPMTIQTVLDHLVLSSDMEDHDDHHLETLIAVLQQLDMDPSMPLTTLMTLGQVAVVTMMMDLGLEKMIAERFYRHCQEISTSRSSPSSFND